jgi:RNA binding exosome subunit
MHFIKSIPFFENNNNSKNIIIYTKKNIDDIEDRINNILDKYDEKCKYYIHCNESYYMLSFNVDIKQYDAMIQTEVQINIFKDKFNDAIIEIDKKIEEHPEWNDIKKDLHKKLSHKI